MCNLKSFKIFLLCVSLMFSALSANAVVDVAYTKDTLKITMPESVKHATFTRFNDVWVVFSRKGIKPAFDVNELTKLGVTDIEQLVLKVGTGYRLRFKDQAPTVRFETNYETRQASIILDNKAIKIKDRNRIKFRVKSANGNNSIKDLFLDSSYILDYAYSLKTGEKYIVAISGDSRLKYPTKEIYEDLLFLPTYSGAAIISQRGEFLVITDEEQLELSDFESEFFKQASKHSTTKALQDFFDKTGLELLERQLRDYSVFNRNIDRFKSEGNYDDVIKRINNALEQANSINYDTKLPTTNNMKVESFNIQEGNVIDMSGSGDDMFEGEGIEEQDVSRPKEQEDIDVLVPEFDLTRYHFMKEKLRLSHIKNTGRLEKEKIIIKRMQLAAFAKYYAEILDLTKLIRLDISGEFPKNNKALALYALSNAKINRCEEVINLPEKDGSIYTKDLLLWKAYCLSADKKFEPALTLFTANLMRVQSYPKDLRDDLTLAYAQSLFGLDNFDQAIAILKKLQKETRPSNVAKVKYNLGMAYLYNNESDLAVKQFKELLFDENKEYKFKARLEYLNLELYNDKVSKMTIINALEDLRFNFRLNQTELDATKLLASLYLQEDYLKQAMDLYKYISIYYPKTESAKYATDTLFNIFYNLFAKNLKTNTNLGYVEKLALFYDFIELTPSDYDGNLIITNVADKLVELGLRKNAIKLLAIQLNYKTKDPDVAQVLGEKLAGLYLAETMFKDALEVLTLTQKAKKPEDYTENAKLIKANILLRMGNTDSAIKILDDLKDNTAAIYALAEIYWHKNDYQNIIKYLDSTFLGKKVVLDELGIINLSYLMVSYALTKNVDKLNQVKELYSSELEKVGLEYKTQFLLKLAGEDVKVNKKEDKLLDIWEKVIDIDNSVIDFIDDYRQEVNYREALKARDYKQLADKYNDRLN